MMEHISDKPRWLSIRRPAVNELTEKEWRQNRFGVYLFLVSQFIPYFVLVNVRVMMAGTFIPPDVNPWFGGLLPTIFLAAGVIVVWLGVGNCRSGNILKLRSLFLTCTVLGLLGIVTLLVPLWAHTWDVLSHYGEVYVTCLGVAAVYTTISVILVLGVIFRAGKGWIGPNTSFGAESAATIWTFNTLAWLALYVTLQLI